MIKKRTTLDIYDISMNILMCIWPVMSSVLVVLINSMFSSGEYPDALKRTRVCPIYKGKGEKTSADNFRPITIGPNISKPVESIISNSLMSHFEQNDLLTDRQFAYRKNMSTTIAAYKIYNYITTALDDKYKVAGIFCDLSKAFDVINHELLLEKLKRYGVENNFHRVLESFLKNRRQTVEVKVNGKRLKSKAGSVDIGIPQGSALGNTLFLAFINDLPSSITEGEVVLFADDTTVVVKARTYEQLETKICRICDQLQRWFSTNGLILNVTKSNIMIFSCRPLLSSPIQCQIPIRETCKFLGFQLDTNLNWKRHVKSLCERLGGAVFALRKLKPLMSGKALVQIYHAYFHSLLSYGIILWGNSADSDRVFIMQKRALRILAGVKPRHSCRDLFTKYKIMSHYSQYLFEILMFTRRNLDSFERVCIPGRITRQTGRLKTVPRRLALLDKNPRVIGPAFYEELPTEIKNEISDEAFGRRLKHLLLNNPLYSVNEYRDIICNKM